jgi:hypothetical protein
LDDKPAGAETAQDDVTQPSAAGQDPVPAAGSEDGEERRLFGMTIRQGMLLAVVVGPLLGFGIGIFGSGSETATTSLELVLDRQDASVLEPGTTDRFGVIVKNPLDEGVQVTSISAGASKATAGGCPAGTLTSAPQENPVGYISPGGVRTYSVYVTMAADAGERCQGQSFTLPLTVELLTAQ